MDGLTVLLTIAAFVLALMAISRQSALSAKISQLTAKVNALEAELVSRPAAASGELAVDAVPEPEEVGAALEAELAAHAPPQPDPASVVTDEPQPIPTPMVAAKPDMEQRLATRWFVWIGGIAMAFGGLLFVKYAYDIGLISPTLQLILGLALGGLLVGAGQRVQARTEADYVPQALTAAGLAIAFGSIYAAYALYELIAPGVAFAGLGIVAIGALLLSLRQGPLVAALGLAGSYLTPTLISSPNPSAWSFFPYLLIIQVACFAILRKRTWWWLGYAAIAGSAVWGLLWLVGPFIPSHALPLGLFALATAGIAIFAIEGREILSEDSGSLAAIPRMSQPLRLGSVGIIAGLAVLVALVATSLHSGAALALFAVGIAGIAAISWFKRGESYVLLPAAVVTLLVLLAWREASFTEWAMSDSGLWASILGSSAKSYASWTLGAGAAFFLLGTAGTSRKQPTWGWAALAAGSAVAFLFFAWARVDGIMSDKAWASIAAVPAVLIIGFIYSREHSHEDPAHNLASGILGIGAAALLVFLMDRLLNGVWFTLSVAAIAMAFAAWTLRSKIWLLAPTAAALASLTALRLFLAREIWFETAQLPWGQHWPLYGYGLPIIGFILAGRWLKRAGHDRYAMAFEGVSLGLAVSLVSLEIRVLIAGSHATPDLQLIEIGSHVMSWLGAAYGLLYRQSAFSSFISRWGARVLIVLSCVVLVFTNLLALNPVVTGEPLLGSAVFNDLLLAYAGPAVLLGFITQKLDVLGWGKLRPAFGILALGLGLAYVTLQTKRLFQGRLIELSSQSNAEGYAYSAVWLACALLLFIVGLKLRRQYLRYAGLAVMVLVVGKVFLLDVAGLGGFYRIGSVFGLGVCLLAIGWLYQRFMQTPPTGGGAAEKMKSATSRS
jgi:uncharacterized membrane protein